METNMGQVDKITVIERIKYAGKWIEFWFTEPDMRLVEGSTFHACSKKYLFYEKMPSDIFQKVYSDPSYATGLIVVWEWNGYNYEIKSVLERNQKQAEIELFRKNEPEFE